jgi:DNA-directed RNA polymerase subunit F
MNRFYHGRFALVFLTLGLLAAVPVARPATEQPGPEFFTKKVLPILQQNCFTCHSHAGGKSKGGLMLDSRNALLTGGDSGPAIVPGKPEESLLLQAVKQAPDAPKMPPKGKLTPEQVAILSDWIKQGAVWPASPLAPKVRPKGQVTAEDRQHWSFQPMREVQPPELNDPRWAANPIDRFIYQRLQREGLSPAPPADPVALIRRVYFNIIGLPPTPEEVAAFVADPSPVAYEKMIDRLLASPHYGERWARPWLDVVRYAESDGYKQDDYRPDAWRYRDYVIRSLNQDKPYDRFLSEQLAGDELAPHDPEALTATGFLRLGIYEYNQRDVPTQWNHILNDLTDVTGDVFLGLGMSCARCHDHKFDPILQKDYYRLQAFFAPISFQDETLLASDREKQEHDRKFAIWQAKTAKVRAELEKLEVPMRTKVAKEVVDKFPEEMQAILRKPEPQRTPLEKQLAALAYRQVLFEFSLLDRRFKGDEKLKLLDLKRQLAAFDAEKPPPLPQGMTVTDIGPVAPPTFLPKKSAEPIAPGFLTLWDEKPATIPTPLPGTTGRRTALAQWLTRPDHPLTARVIVNRIWQQHFGRGLVATASDFGKLGEPPSHPELLDWLAQTFVQEGWSLKKLHRRILLSQTYRQAAHVQNPTAAQKDPENRLLWRMNPRRLEAEQIRDTILAATGKLRLELGGPSVPATQPRRTIYTRQQRNVRDPLLEVFDLPEAFQSVAERYATTTPTQALLLMNSPLLLQYAQALAERLQAEKPVSEAALVESAYRRVFGRPPSSEETQTAVAFLRRPVKELPPAVAQAPASVGTFRSSKLPFRDGNAALMQPASAQPCLHTVKPMPLPEAEFTLEAFVQLRSLYEDGTVRTIAAQTTGKPGGTGWAFAVTSKKSAYKPQTLALLLWGGSSTKPQDYEAVFSDLHLDLNKPYFVAVTVRLAETGKAGITFYTKDLSNDDEPLQTGTASHRITRLNGRPQPFTIGGQETQPQRTWDGLIDDVRLSRTALRPEQLLLTTDGVTSHTLGYWQFEPVPGVWLDSSSGAWHLRTPEIKKQKVTTTRKVPPSLVDFCHVLLNANEFLFVD